MNKAAMSGIGIIPPPTFVKKAQNPVPAGHNNNEAEEPTSVDQGDTTMTSKAAAAAAKNIETETETQAQDAPKAAATIELPAPPPLQQNSQDVDRMLHAIATVAVTQQNQISVALGDLELRNKQFEAEEKRIEEDRNWKNRHAIPAGKFTLGSLVVGGVLLGVEVLKARLTG